MENEKVCIYHNDNDGITAAAIVKLRFSNVKFIPMDYGWDFDIIAELKDKDCIIVDFSFQHMQLIKEACNSLIWIDHHKTAMEQNPEIWNDEKVLGIRSLDKSGCELAWEFLMPKNIEMPNAVKWVGDYDTWTFKHKETKTFGAAFSLNINNPTDNLLIAMISMPTLADIFEEKLLNEGSILLRAQTDRVKKSFKQGKKIKFHDLNGVICNCNIKYDISNLGNYICKQGYDIGIVWCIDKDIVRVDLRSIGETDVSAIAKSYGGGGHKNAAGFELPINKLNQIIKEEK